MVALLLCLFASLCALNFMQKRDGTKHIVLRLRSLGGDPQAKDSSHIWVSQKATLYSNKNDLPEHPAFE